MSQTIDLPISIPCQCRACLRERREMVGGMPAEMTRMIACSVCGDKRCPHAADHRNECTTQPGSACALGNLGSVRVSAPAPTDAECRFAYKAMVDAKQVSGYTDFIACNPERAGMSFLDYLAKLKTHAESAVLRAQK